MSADAPYAGVIIDISHERLDRPFTYRIPEKLRGKLLVGSSVLVPFGKGDRLRTGFVVSLDESAQYPDERIKEIRGEAKGTSDVTATAVKLAAWMRKQYGSTMIQALKTVIPAAKKTGKLKRRYVSLRITEREARALCGESLRKKHVARARLLSALLEDPATRLHYELVTGKLGVSAAVMKGLQEKGVIRIEYEEYYRNPTSDAAYSSPEQGALTDAGLTLSDEQQAVVDGVLDDFDAGERRTYLLHGITGSGKTEVYIRLIGEMVGRGRQAIVLIPEIALTFQTLMRFYRHFGDRVSVMHSMLSAGEKFDQFERARKGEIDVIIGPRSALFTPFSHLGLIIMDEEHEPTYKSETMPKYHARETAIALAKITEGGASVLLGSATPSLEAYSRALEGEYGLFTLSKRLTGGTLAETEIVDLRDELSSGNRSVFSRRLQTLLNECLSREEQAMLFLNRRGLAGFVSCRACGYVFKCPHCDVSLSEHKGGRLICHYCGHEDRVQKICPQCGSSYVSAFRAGTQQIEREVTKLFPKARVLRMDADTTRGKHDYEAILQAFANREADILVGTQMIVKGHDFPDVTLVGILTADMSLNGGDYRSAERTFQLLTQAAGRAGRGTRKGNVVIQTYQPDHYSIVASAAQDYQAFYDEEMTYRRMLRYPPAAHLLAVQIFARAEGEGAAFANACAEVAKDKTRGTDAVIIGPAPASIGRINDIFRIVLYVKSADGDVLSGIRETLDDRYRTLVAEGRINGNTLQMQFDYDPVRGF